MSRPSVLAGRDLGSLARLALDLGAAIASPTLVNAPHPVDYLTRRPLADGTSAVVILTRSDNLGDIAGMFRANRGVAFVLLTEDNPPHAALARVVAEHAGACLPVDESPMVIAATVIALLSRHGAIAV